MCSGHHGFVVARAFAQAQIESRERASPAGQIIKAVSAVAVMLAARYLLTRLLGPAAWAELLTYTTLAFVATFGLPVAITLGARTAAPVTTSRPRGGLYLRTPRRRV